MTDPPRPPAPRPEFAGRSVAKRGPRVPSLKRFRCRPRSADRASRPLGPADGCAAAPAGSAGGEVFRCWLRGGDGGEAASSRSWRASSRRQKKKERRFLEALLPTKGPHRLTTGLPPLDRHLPLLRKRPAEHVGRNRRPREAIGGRENDQAGFQRWGSRARSSSSLAPGSIAGRRVSTSR